MQVLQENIQYGITLAVAFIVAFIMTPLIRKLSKKADVLDYPTEKRRIHKQPIPKMGGLAIVCGFFVAILLNVLLNIFDLVTLIPQSMQMVGYLAGACIIVLMGSIDDIYGLPPYVKFVFQFAAAIIVICFGTNITSFSNPFSETGYIAIPKVLGWIITFVWIVGITNAINFIDGVDGLAAGVSSICMISLFLVSILSEDKQMMAVSIMTASLAGSTLGFLPYNLHPAKIFMTDIGSNFLGFSLAVFSIQGSMKSYAAISLAIPILVLGLPIFDVIFAIIRRIKHKQSIVSADRGHVHHRLLDIGLSQRQTVSILYLVTALLGACAVMLTISSKKNYSQQTSLFAVLLILACGLAISLFVRFLSHLKIVRGEQGQSENQSSAQSQEGESSVVDPDDIIATEADGEEASSAYESNTEQSPEISEK